MPKHVLMAAVVLALAMPAAAQTPPVRTEQVRFAPGTASQTIRGTIRGYQAVDYALSARAGQTMTVTFQSSNASSYFNVTASGAQEAMFVGATSGSSFSGTLPASGEYRVRVYLMRNAARRNETANYTLTIGVAAQGSDRAAAAPAASGAPITRGNMPAFCRGEAAQQYGTRPTYVQTGAIQAARGGGSSIEGTVDKGSEGTKRFRCRFDSGGRFIDVMALTPDGE